jgi:hypothetical protein
VRVTGSPARDRPNGCSDPQLCTPVRSLPAPGQNRGEGEGRTLLRVEVAETARLMRWIPAVRENDAAACCTSGFLGTLSLDARPFRPHNLYRRARYPLSEVTDIKLLTSGHFFTSSKFKSTYVNYYSLRS